MHLSKIFVSWKKVRNPYDVHKALWQLFPNRSDDKRDFLFRIEKTKRNIGAEILLQSEQEPFESYNFIRVVAKRNYDVNLAEGQMLRFRLRANPIKTITDARGRQNQKGTTKKCRVPLIKAEAQKAWIVRKLDSVCSIEALNLRREIPLYFRKKTNHRAGKIQTVLFDGILRVNVPDDFVNKLRKGIGPAKAFGCGLLSLSPV